MLDFGSLGSDCLIPWKSVTFFRMMLLDAGPLGNSSPLFCDLYEKKVVVSIICGRGDFFCGVDCFQKNVIILLITIRSTETLINRLFTVYKFEG